MLWNLDFSFFWCFRTNYWVLLLQIHLYERQEYATGIAVYANAYSSHFHPQALMAVFFKIRSPILLDDVFSGNITKWGDHNFSTQYVMDEYDKNALNCGIATILYIILFVFALIQLRLNNTDQEAN